MTPEEKARAANTRANLQSAAGRKVLQQQGLLPLTPEPKKP